VAVLSAPQSDGSDIGAHRVEVRLLGPFEVMLAGLPVHIGSPKQRAVLALLALQAGRVVSAETLCDLIWDVDQPASPSATLQSLISRLRATLAAERDGVATGGREVVRTREPGWVLDIDAAAVDALRFLELTARARRRRAQGEPEAAVADLTKSIALWRGAALLDVVDAGYLAGHATRLNEARLDAIEDLADAELATGRPADAITRLESHVDANPLRERGWGLLMVSLYRVGRQSAALRAYQQLRGILAQELGLEPSPDLVRIEQQILHHDPALAGPRPEDTQPQPPAPTPPKHSAEKLGAGEFADYTVVVVEDHDFQRRTVVQLLRGLGVGTVKDAADGAEALRILQEGRVPDVVICDIDMPGMDGVEFVTRIAESNLACSVVIASGLESNVLRAVESIGEGHGLHILAALPKPLTARRLGEVLGQYTRLNRERADHPAAAALSAQDLRDAFDGGRLTPQFEPRIDLTTGAFSSVEAGGYWRSPDGVPVASSSLVAALTSQGVPHVFMERLVDESLTLLETLGQAGLDVEGCARVALDVSPLVSDTSLADRLGEMVRDRGHGPQRVVCQLDDGALARASSTAFAVLTRLRVKGFGLSMTHCGVGPPWTHQLGRVPLTELKLGRALVSSATLEPKRFEVLEAAVTSARETSLPVVADGCDTQADLDMLLALGCSEAQGVCVAAPMDASEVVAWAGAGYLADAQRVPR
jgi:DNA-binding SARP family transcriptional activator/EAL domain-containing protein (putative c-di-GMP-specific phosphodiesterase class I)/FixJ family two-component response regulator